VREYDAMQVLVALLNISAMGQCQSALNFPGEAVKRDLYIVIIVEKEVSHY
jgi:hypothetical protein